MRQKFSTGVADLPIIPVVTVDTKESRGEMSVPPRLALWVICYVGFPGGEGQK